MVVLSRPAVFLLVLACVLPAAGRPPQRPCKEELEGRPCKELRHLPLANCDVPGEECRLASTSTGWMIRANPKRYCPVLLRRWLAVDADLTKGAGLEDRSAAELIYDLCGDRAIDSLRERFNIGIRAAWAAYQWRREAGLRAMKNGGKPLQRDVATLRKEGTIQAHSENTTVAILRVFKARNDPSLVPAILAHVERMTNSFYVHWHLRYLKAFGRLDDAVVARFRAELSNPNSTCFRSHVVAEHLDRISRGLE